MWGLVQLETDNLTIRDVHIDSLLPGNREGLDIVDCHHVLVERVTISAEDDALCIKSGARRGVEDVTVRSSHILRSTIGNALKVGTASYGSFRNLTFEDIVIDHADKAAMAVESVDGADISNLTFRRISFQDVGSPIFVLLGDRGTPPAGEGHKVGSIDGLLFENIVGSNLRYHWSSPISGSRAADGSIYRLRNLAFRGVHVTNKGGRRPVPADPPEYHGQYPDPNLWGDLPAYGYFIRHADRVTFSHSTTDVAPGDARHWLESRDVSNLTVE
jgi:polygalacturonase